MLLELRACDESCAGGVLTTQNRFLTVERLRKRAKYFKDTGEDIGQKDILNYKDYLNKSVVLGKIKPR